MARSDGLSHTDFLLLSEELGETYANRLESSEYLMMDYTIHKVPSEIELLKRMRQSDLERLEQVFAEIEPGTTKIEDSGITVFRRMSRANRSAAGAPAGRMRWSRVATSSPRRCWACTPTSCAKARPSRRRISSGCGPST